MKAILGNRSGPGISSAWQRQTKEHVSTKWIANVPPHFVSLGGNRKNWVWSDFHLIYVAGYTDQCPSRLCLGCPSSNVLFQNSISTASVANHLMTETTHIFFERRTSFVLSFFFGRERDNVVYWKTNGKINNDLQ